MNVTRARLLPFALLLMIFTFLVSIPIYAQYAGGEGTESDPWKITSVEQLQSIADNPDAHFILIADINASSTADWNDGLGFEPIGDFWGTRFSGSLNGNGFSITGLTIKLENQNYVGLFGVVQNGGLKNIILKDVEINGRNNTGGLAGSLVDGSVLNSAVSGTITGNDYTGGLIGSMDQSTVQQSYTNASISGETQVGGLAGLSYISDIYSSYSHSVINGQSYVGGLVGVVTSFGYDSDDESSVMYGTYAAGPVNGDEYTGGLIGEVEWIVLTKSAQSSEESNSDSNSVLTSYWDIEMSGQAGAVSNDMRWEGFRIDTSGASTSAMYQQSTYEGWDFDEVWAISEGESYPWLQKLGMPVSNELEPHHADLPRSVELHQNYPNPFNPVTVIEYQLPVSSDVTLEVFDLTGRRVAVLVDELRPAGQNRISFNASGLSSGVYLYRLSAGELIRTRKMIMVK